MSQSMTDAGTGLQTVIKCGRNLPIVYLPMSVRTTQNAPPIKKYPKNSKFKNFQQISKDEFKIFKHLNKVTLL